MENNLSFAMELLNNLGKFKKVDEIEDKNVKKVYERCQNWEDVYMYILNLLKDENSSKAKALKVDVYSFLDKEKYRDDYILAIQEYLKDLDEDDIESLRRFKEKYYNQPITYDLAKNILRASLFERLSYLEFKRKNYNDALNYIDEAIELADITQSMVKLKVDILLKLKRKNGIIEFLNNIKKSSDYQSVKDMEFDEMLEITNKDILRKYFVKFEVDMTLQSMLDN